MNPLEKRRKVEDELTRLRKERAGLEAQFLANMRQTRLAVQRARNVRVPMRQVEELTGLSHMTLYRHMATAGGTRTSVQLLI